VGFDFDIWTVMMIEKLYNLKKMQTDQKIAQKGKVQAQISALNEDIEQTNIQMTTTSVDKTGAISDFAVLQMHKNTMKAHIVQLNSRKRVLEKQLEKMNEELIELLKESEQYKYMLEEQKKLELIEAIKKEEEQTAEYVQSKYIAS
jgi:chromosome segregation ATPase